MRPGIAILGQQYIALRPGPALAITHPMVGARGVAVKARTGWLAGAIALAALGEGCIAPPGGGRLAAARTPYRPRQIRLNGAVDPVAVMEGSRRRNGRMMSTSSR